MLLLLHHLQLLQVGLLLQHGCMLHVLGLLRVRHEGLRPVLGHARMQAHAGWCKAVLHAEGRMCPRLQAKHWRHAIGGHGVLAEDGGHAGMLGPHWYACMHAGHSTCTFAPAMQHLRLRQGRVHSEHGCPARLERQSPLQEMQMTGTCMAAKQVLGLGASGPLLLHLGDLVEGHLVTTHL